MSVVLNGSSQYLYTATVPVAAPALTLAAWFKSTSDAIAQTIACIGDHDTSNLHVGNMAAMGSVAGDPIQAQTRSAAANGWANTSSGFDANVWTHACCVFAATNSRSAYINGGSGNTTTTDVATITADELSVGVKTRDIPQAYFSGRLAHLAVWNVALSEVNIAALAAGADPSGVDADHLVAYWPLYNDANDDKGTNHLTAVGSPTWDEADNPDVGGVEYVEAAITIAGTSTTTIAAEVLEYVSAALTIAGTSSTTIGATASVRSTSSPFRLIAIGDGEVWYS